MPFARLSDYGVLCFDANQISNDNDYRVVSFDNEDGYKIFEVYSDNFEAMFSKFEEDINEKIKKL